MNIAFIRSTQDSTPADHGSESGEGESALNTVSKVASDQKRSGEYSLSTSSILAPSTAICPQPVNNSPSKFTPSEQDIRLLARYYSTIHNYNSMQIF